jgi:hypothetical protein
VGPASTMTLGAPGRGRGGGEEARWCRRGCEGDGGDEAAATARAPPLVVLPLGLEADPFPGSFIRAASWIGDIEMFLWEDKRDGEREKRQRDVARRGRWG